MDVPLPSTGQGLGLPGRQDRGGRGPAVLSPHTDLLGAGWLQPGARWPPLCARTQPQGWLQYYLQIKTTEGITECDPEDTPRASPREPKPRGVGVDGRCPPQWSLRPHAGFTGSQVRSPASREAEAAGMGRWATWLAWALVTEPSGGAPGGKDSPLGKGPRPARKEAWPCYFSAPLGSPLAPDHGPCLKERDRGRLCRSHGATRRTILPGSVVGRQCTLAHGLQTAADRLRLPCGVSGTGLVGVSTQP